MVYYVPSTVTIPILQMKKLRLGEAKKKKKQVTQLIQNGFLKEGIQSLLQFLP